MPIAHTPCGIVWDSYSYLVASVCEGLGNLIPTKTSRLVAQLFLGVCSAESCIISDHVFSTFIVVLLFLLVLLARALSICNLLLIALIHRFFMVFSEWSVP